MVQKINYDYLKPINEVFILAAISLKRKSFHSNSKKKDKILVANSCLIGDFIVSLPALRQFIKNNKKSKIDLIVSPPIKPLAEKIRGINNVFIAKSVFSRTIENSKDEVKRFEDYEEIIIMRGSRESYKIVKNLNTLKIKTSLPHFVKYGIHLAKNLITKNSCKQWREINFEILDQKFRNIKFEDIFNFNKQDYEKIKKLDVLRTKEKIIIIHTGSTWSMNMWENKKWINLIKKINSFGKFRFVFVGGKVEESDYKIIAKKLDFPIYSLINKINLQDLILVLRLSNYFIGVDSGPKNMAHLANLRSISLMGPGPHMFMPISKKDIVIDKSNGKGLYQRFFYKKNSFIKKITSEEVFEAFKKLSKAK